MCRIYAIIWGALRRQGCVVGSRGERFGRSSPPTHTLRTMFRGCHLPPNHGLWCGSIAGSHIKNRRLRSRAAAHDTAAASRNSGCSAIALPAAAGAITIAGRSCMRPKPSGSACHKVAHTLTGKVSSFAMLTSVESPWSSTPAAGRSQATFAFQECFVHCRIMSVNGRRVGSCRRMPAKDPRP